MQKTIYFDIDGIILNFAGPFATFWNNNGYKQISDNPSDWTFGIDLNNDNLKNALELFHKIHEHLPLMDPDIPQILKQLQKAYRIELVTSYPHVDKRIENLLFHDIACDKLICDISDKLSYVKGCEDNGSIIIAIFEDSPSHLDKYLPHYSGKLWAPHYWNYLQDYKQCNGIQFYHSCFEWLKLLE